MQLNSDYDKLIILNYFSGGGGKFLCACLGLSDDAIFMQKTWKQLNVNAFTFSGDISENLTKIQMQLDDKLLIEKKLKYLLLTTKEQSEKQIWDDWGLGGFWGIRENEIVENNLKEYTYIFKKIKKIIDECINNNNKFMFLAIHDDKIVISMLKYWRNSKVIIFKNEQKFASKRTLGRFDTTLEIGLHSMTKLQLDQSKLNNLSYEWDCDWYFSKDKTISEIEKLYDSFGLSGFNAEIISIFYEAWINAIKL